MTRFTLLHYASLEASRPDSGAAAFAAGMAAALDAHLDVVAAHADGLAPGHWEAPAAAEIEQTDAGSRRELSALVDAIVARARARGVSAAGQTDWAHAFGPVAFIGDQARLRDFVVAGVDRSVFLSERKMVEHVLFEAGRPVVVVPADHPPVFSCRRVMVAWDHTRTAARALHDALPLLRLADEVILTIIGGEKRFQTNPERAAIEATLARKGLNARVEQIELGSRTIGEALQDRARALDADLLVMGAFGHSRLRDFILGGATREILDHPRLPVLLSH